MLKHSALACLVSSTLAGPAGASETVLERVLRLVDGQGVGLTANIAQSLSGGQAPLTLQSGNSVVVGHDALGLPVTVVAGPTGVMVDDATRARMASGLSAGLYPLGSALYRLPPAGQLSLWQEAADGQALAMAREMIVTRIDGRIGLTAIGSLTEEPRFAELAATAVTASALASVVGERISSTVLGVSNAGLVALSVDPLAELDLSSITRGLSDRIEEASSGSAVARAAGSRAMAAPTVSLNIGSNASDVTGAVRLHIEAVNLRIGQIAPTVLGAVNAGRIVAQD